MHAKPARGALALTALVFAVVPALAADLVLVARGPYAVGDGPQYLATGDFDADGIPDIVTANRNGNSVSILRGNGDGTFKPATSFAAGAGAISVAVGDLNNDGVQDLVTANFTGGTLSVLMGAGGATFLPPQSFAAGAAAPGCTGPNCINPNCVALADFDGNGAPDAVVADFGDNLPSSRTAAVLMGNGIGVLGPAQTQAAQRGPLWVAVADFNHDGRADLATANFGADTVSTFMGNGDGTFAAGATLSAPGGSAAVTVADFDGDGHQDLAVVEYFSNQVYTLMGHGDESFSPGAHVAVGLGPVSAAAADFDGDGLLDLAVANWNHNAGNTVSLLVGRGDGSFEPAQDFPAGHGAVGVVAADLNHDGKPDIAVSNLAGNSVSILMNNGGPTGMRTLTVDKGGSGTGVVSSSPAGIDCGAVCAAGFAVGSPVTLSAAPTGGSTFAGWSGGACSGTGTCTVTLNAATLVTASFEAPAQQFTLTVNKAGSGTGTVTSSPAGITCGATCAASYDPGTVVTLSAMPSGGSTFSGWSAAGCSGVGTCTVTMNAAASVVATFTAQPQQFALTVTKTGTGSGTVTSSPAGINCGASCSAGYNAGTVVTLSAAAAAGSTFTGWIGVGCLGSGPCSVTLNSSTTIVATFVRLGLPLVKWQDGGCNATWCQTGWYGSPAVADLDGDGQAEVAWGSYDLVALNGATGALRWRAPSANRVWSSVAVADLTGNGTPELIAGRSADELTVYDRSGTVLFTRRPFGGGEIRSLAAGDLDGDGQVELVVGSTQDSNGARQMSVYEPSGAVRSGWPARHATEPGYGGGMYNQNVALGDLAGSGALQVLGPSGGHYIAALDAAGRQLPASSIYDAIDPPGAKTWSQVGVHVDDAVDRRGYANCGSEHRPDFSDSSPVVADVDGDGSRELVVIGNVYNCGTDPYASLYQMPFILRADRTRWASDAFDWTVLPAPRSGSGPRSENYDVIETVAPNPAVADLDGDGRKEIVFPSYDGRVHAYWLDKTEHGHWPYTVPSSGVGDDDFRFASEVVVVDLDADGQAETIFTTWPKKATGRTGQLVVLKAAGDELFKVDLPPSLDGGWNGGLGAPTLANLDGDADLEVVVGTAASGVVAYDLPGTPGARVLWPTGRGGFARKGAPSDE